MVYFLGVYMGEKESGYHVINARGNFSNSSFHVFEKWQKRRERLPTLGRVGGKTYGCVNTSGGVTRRLLEVREKTYGDY